MMTTLSSTLCTVQYMLFLLTHASEGLAEINRNSLTSRQARMTKKGHDEWDEAAPQRS